MEDSILIKKFSLVYDEETIFHKMDCDRNSPSYDQMTETYEMLKDEMEKAVRPIAGIAYGYWMYEGKCERIPIGSSIVYCMISLGSQIGRISTSYFQQGDYLAGYMADVICDELLFQIDQVVLRELKMHCAQRKKGVLQRLEAPRDFPMDVQRIILENIWHSHEEMGNISITEGYMYNPIKTNGCVFLLTEDEHIFQGQHDCRRCSSYPCKFSKHTGIPVQIVDRDGTYNTSCMEGESILEAMRRNNMGYSAVCGGTGKCGKCRIMLLEGDLSVTAGDRKVFSEEQLERGYRLACSAYPKNPCTIRLLEKREQEIYGVDFSKHHLVTESYLERRVNKAAYGVGIDIGTTTIAFALVNLTVGSIAAEHTVWNRQRFYGADIITRIEATNKGKGKMLQEAVQRSILEGLQRVLEKAGVEEEKVQTVGIGANTTMIHLLMGFPCNTLGTYPFTSEHTEMICTNFFQIFPHSTLHAPVVIFPSISAFVGGDIVSGLLLCGTVESEEIHLLIDLGTNGEVVIGRKGRILSASTAAGPAFEGGNISCGVASIPGAIYSASLEENHFSCKTIGDRLPIGICGTGVIEIMAELLENHLIDETGFLIEPYFQTGVLIGRKEDGEPIYFTQKDVREFQLAKAAIRAGVEVLLRRYGVSYEQVAHVYLAGGFGYHVNVKKAIQIGLLPRRLQECIKPIGNSALGGIVKFLLGETNTYQIEEIISFSEGIDLSQDRDFQRLYVEHMVLE